MIPVHAVPVHPVPLVPRSAGREPAHTAAAVQPADRIVPSASAESLGALRHAAAMPYDRHTPAPTPGVVLATGPQQAAAIAAGAHQIRTVDGHRLTYPSQDLTRIESARPDEPGQTHALARHVGTTLADNVARLTAAPLLHAAGSYTSLADAQYATNETIANPENQRAIGAFLGDDGRLKFALARVELGRSVGTSTLQRDVAAGHPTLIPGTTATVVIIKDPSFPEGYRVLTTYPELRPPEVDARGHRLA